jgi:hypothetical protein
VGDGAASVDIELGHHEPLHLPSPSLRCHLFSLLCLASFSLLANKLIGYVVFVDMRTELTRLGPASSGRRGAIGCKGEAELASSIVKTGP